MQVPVSPTASWVLKSRSFRRLTENQALKTEYFRTKSFVSSFYLTLFIHVNITQNIEILQNNKINYLIPDKTECLHASILISQTKY